jgi:hypothetical protein
MAVRSPLRNLPLACSLLLFAACESSPIQPKTCVPTDVGSYTVPAGATVESILPALEDAATRVAPALVGDAKLERLGPALHDVAARASAGDVLTACLAFNRAVAATEDFAAVAPPKFRPDIGAVRLALVLAHAWLEAQTALSSAL